MTIQELIENERVKEAIQLLIDNATNTEESNSAILLMSRYKNLQRSTRLNLITYSESNTNRNQIVQAILSLAEDNMIASVPSGVVIESVSSSIEDSLQSIIKSNRRRRPNITQTAQVLLDDFRSYGDDKSNNSSFDPSGRRYDSLLGRLSSLKNTLLENQKDSLEDIVGRVNALLTDPIPSYRQLEEAYKLVLGRGKKDNWIEDQLVLRTEDTEIRITMAEKIEEYVSQISTY